MTKLCGCLILDSVDVSGLPILVCKATEVLLSAGGLIRTISQPETKGSIVGFNPLGLIRQFTKGLFFQLLFCDFAACPCQSQSKSGPCRGVKRGHGGGWFLRFGGRARHKANARQSACWPLGRHSSELGGAVLLSGFATVFEAVAFTVHLKDVDLVGQTIQ